MGLQAMRDIGIMGWGRGRLGTGLIQLLNCKTPSMKKESVEDTVGYSFYVYFSCIYKSSVSCVP